MSDAPALECRAVSVGHLRPDGARPEAPVLSGVSFAVGRGEILIVVGRSGSGKSTLLRVLNRLAEPLSGTVSFDGRPVTELDPTELRRRVALVQQRPTVFEGTVRDNLLVRPLHEPAPPEATLAQALEEVGLPAALLDRAASALSVGEQQRLCFARALVPGPRVLLLDEPTSALDPRAVLTLAELVARLAAQRGLSVVVATHQPELVRRLGGSTLLLADGRARADVSAAELDEFLGGG